MSKFSEILGSTKYKENWLYMPGYNSCTVKDKQPKIGVWTDIGR